MMEPSEASARILASLLASRTGQQLGTSRGWRLETSLRPLMRERDFAGLDDLASALVAGHDTQLGQEVVEALLNNETYFFRDRASFDLLLRGALPGLHKAREAKKRLSIWCAGCSTGQEVYSIAMTIAEERLRWQGWTVDILGTDVSRSAVEQARQGLYSQFEVQRGLPVMQMMRWFSEEGPQQWRLSQQLRDTVEFRVHNLADQPPPGRFDIILCRNVLLYFPDNVRRQVFARLAEALAPDGCLMLGAGETVIGQSEDFVSDPEHRGLYILKPKAAPAQIRARSAAGA